MPFKSKSQQRWMYANEPEMAKKWSDHTPSHKSLPEKAKKKKKRKEEEKTAIAELAKQAAIVAFVKTAQPPSIGDFPSGGDLLTPVTSANQQTLPPFSGGRGFPGTAKARNLGWDRLNASIHSFKGSRGYDVDPLTGDVNKPYTLTPQQLQKFNEFAHRTTAQRFNQINTPEQKRVMSGAKRLYDMDMSHIPYKGT